MCGRLLIRRFRRTLAHLTRRNSLSAASFVPRPGASQTAGRWTAPGRFEFAGNVD